MKILDLVDVQNSFIKPSGNLYIKGAINLIDKINNFINEIPTKFFDATLIKF